MILHIQLPTHDEALAFNRQRWAEVHADATLAASPHRIETNAFGQIIMTPPPGGPHCAKQFLIAFQLQTRLGGRAFAECPISTMDGVRAADAAWYSHERYQRVAGQLAFEVAPEICVEVLRPQNTDAEMQAKRQLYFAAGAIECWTCRADGQMTYYHRSQPDAPMSASKLCPHFPSTIND